MAVHVKKIRGKAYAGKKDQWINWVNMMSCLREDIMHHIIYWDCTALAEVRFLRSTDLKLKEFL